MVDTGRIPLELPSRVMNQAGTLGYSPETVKSSPGSVFVMNPVSSRARVPSSDRGMIPFPGGFLLHTGLPNPGWKAVRRIYARHWEQSSVPVWAHLFSSDLAELESMVRDCEETDGIAAIELGLPPDCPRDWMLQLIAAAAGELPLILHVSLGEDQYLFRNLPPEVAAVTLAAPRGSLTGQDGRIIHGRLHGPALFPLLLGGLFKMKGCGVPVILSGICNPADAKAALKCGAAAVQIDHFCWRGPLTDPME